VWGILQDKVYKTCRPMPDLDDLKHRIRTEGARCFVSLNVSLSYSKSLKIVENNAIPNLGYGFLFAFCSKYGRMPVSLDTFEIFQIMT